ncbi:MAG: hypothetical protein AB8B49_11355, partial [Nitratireductor sp.]
VMYDRMISLGRFAERPIATGGPKFKLQEHVHGMPVFEGGKKIKGQKGRDRHSKAGKSLGEN